ncbi:MAG: 4-hydroxy-3-methylbut-2-enyl diphosphate reductase [Alphaproteobacteria bacterium]|jgi:4-hydroxy-3-methylbut-2-enyl diphosphate reductase
MSKPSLTVLLAKPRGFCAGVERAIHIVEAARDRYDEPVYVRHEIVHNRNVVERLEAEGAIFVDELDEVPDGAPVVFSAHGVPKAVVAEAGSRGLRYIDATCPLVSKVHREAERHYEAGREIILVGHAGHPEVIGTMGQLPEGGVLLVESVEDAETVSPAHPERLAYITQTTLSVDDCADVIAVLQRRFPGIRGPHREDICYATTNRQKAVKLIAAGCEALIVVGAPNSSNSLRLVEVARNAGCPRAFLVERAADIDWQALGPVRRIGLTAGASAPEVLVQEVLRALDARFDVTVEEVEGPDEAVRFNLPRALTA